MRAEVIPCKLLKHGVTQVLGRMKTVYWGGGVECIIVKYAIEGGHCYNKRRCRVEIGVKSEGIDSPASLAQDFTGT